MSTYGSTTAVVIQPYISTQEFRDAVHAAMPTCIAALAPEGLSGAAASSLLSDAAGSGLITATQAATARNRISAAERSEVASAAASTLARLGFQVRVAAGETTSIWAERDHQIMAVEVHDGGGFAYDLAGIEGLGCTQIVEDFTAGLAERGVLIRASQTAHNDPRGGQLVRRVMKAALPRPTSATGAKPRQTQ